MNKSQEFQGLAENARLLSRRAFTLYDKLAGTEPRPTATEDGRFIRKGFEVKEHYIAAMHNLWDATAKLLFRLSMYHRNRSPAEIPYRTSLVEQPLNAYLDFFERYAPDNLEIVPDQAFFLAACASDELGRLYRAAAATSTAIGMNDFAFARELQAIEIYPLQFMGILHMANQSAEERRLNLYLKNAGAVAAILRQKAGSILKDGIRRSEFSEIPAMIHKTIPNLMDNAPLIADFLRNSGESGEGLILKALIMSEVLSKMGNDRSEKTAEGILSSIASRRFRQSGSPAEIQKTLRDALPEDLYPILDSIPTYDSISAQINLEKVLYNAIDHEIHRFIRALYYAIPYKDHIYPKLIRRAGNSGGLFAE